MPITEDVKDFLSLFDTKKDGIIDEKEIITLNKVLNDHAGKDKVLDKNELLQIFGLTPQSKNADKIFEQFQTVVQRASKYSSQTTKTLDQTGKEHRTVNTFEADGKTIKTSEKSYYKRGALHKDYYEGANLQNRLNYLPSERTVYEDDGKNIKQVIKNQFNENGILIGREEYNKDGKLVDKKDFSKVDGHFDASYQGGRGDCYLLAAINSLSETEAGEKLLQQNVKENKDGTYTINFPGVAIARKTLISGEGGANVPTKDGKKLKKLPENKVHLTGNYTITPEELEEASKLAGKKYSSGDKDVLLLELAYEKYRDEVMDTIEDNNIKQEQTLYIAGLDMGSQTDKGDYLSGGGCDSAIFILTGKQAEAYNVSSKNKPVCYVDSDFNMHVPDENNIINKKAMAVHTTVDGAGRNDNLDKLLDKLRQDSKDGKVDNYAATASFKVSSQEVNGKIIGGGGHGLSVLKVTDDTVTLSNPWSPEDHIEMSIDDFKKSSFHMSLTKVNEKSTNTINKPNYTIPKGMGYTTMIKNALIKQGIEATKENIQKAKAQFEQVNPDAVHTYNGKKEAWKGNKFLYVNAQVFIPNFKL